ncbi:MAG: EcsC family protein [Bdellovibrionia bacterium]
METRKFLDKELDFLSEAAQFFENPGLFIKGLDMMSTPMEMVQKQLPDMVRKQLARASRAAIEHALIISLKTVSANSSKSDLSEAQKKSKLKGKLHSGVAGLVGGIGGFFGLAALPLELPIATVVMLRSIAEIAREHGVDLNSPEAKVDCLYILSMGGGSPRSDTLESEYYTSRVAFGELLSTATSFIAANTAKDIVAALESRSAPALIRLVAEVSTRFQVQLTRKFLAQVTPVVGAAGGAGLNLMFASYYNKCARFHFGLKSLEKTHGIEATRSQFEKFRIEKAEKVTG